MLLNLTSLVFPLYWDRTSWGKSGVGDFSLPRTMRVPKVDGYLKSISITIYHQVGHDIHQNMSHNGKIFLHQTDYICCQKSCDIFPFVLKLWNCLKMPFLILLFITTLCFSHLLLFHFSSDLRCCLKYESQCKGEKKRFVCFHLL